MLLIPSCIPLSLQSLWRIGLVDDRSGCGQGPGSAPTPHAATSAVGVVESLPRHPHRSVDSGLGRQIRASFPTSLFETEGVFGARRPGIHQLALPHSSITAGTRIIRTIVASLPT